MGRRPPKHQKFARQYLRATKTSPGESPYPGTSRADNILGTVMTLRVAAISAALLAGLMNPAHAAPASAHVAADREKPAPGGQGRLDQIDKETLRRLDERDFAFWRDVCEVTFEAPQHFSYDMISVCNRLFGDQ
jgi:hypothetical protein